MICVRLGFYYFQIRFVQSSSADWKQKHYRAQVTNTSNSSPRFMVAAIRQPVIQVVVPLLWQIVAIRISVQNWAPCVKTRTAVTSQKETLCFRIRVQGSGNTCTFSTNALHPFQVSSIAQKEYSNVFWIELTIGLYLGQIGYDVFNRHKPTNI